ncbi:ABC transporter permease [Gynuella sp.]|uniref:ABC transporter permease n=1 Tax=Gynuella sp. TaxID=2969146 RepID=UPI003D0A36F3
MKTGFKLLWRDWKGGELNILLVSLLVAVATVTSISLFSERIRNTIDVQAGVLLAGDAQLRGSQAIPAQWQQQADDLGLKTTDMMNFQAMAFSAQGMQLTSVKAVSGSYPLKGRVTVSDKPFIDGVEVSSAPGPGEIWMASRLFGALGIKVGDQVTIGEATLTATKALLKEPDSPQSMFFMSPRVIMNIADVAATESVQAGSRIRYGLVLSGTDSEVEQLRSELEPQLGDHYRWVMPREGNRGIGSAMDRAESFLLLAGSLGVMLAGVALALASRRYSLRQAGHVALLKTLGMGPSAVARLYLLNLFLLAVFGVLLGWIAGWLAHWAILKAFASLLPGNIATAGTGAYMTGGLTGLICLMAFAAPPLLALRNVPPSRVLRVDDGEALVSGTSALMIGILAVVVLVLWYSRSLAITAALIGGGIVSLISVSVFAWLLIRLSRRLGAHLGSTWRLGLASLQRHSRQNSLQVMIFSVALLLLFVLSLVRTSLIQDWQRQLPQDAPNHFMFNIFNLQKDAIEGFLDGHQISHSPFYPMVRGRVTAVNGTDMKTLLEQLAVEDDSSYQRELNLTWSNELGPDNEVVEGQWWQPGDEQKSLVSVEEDYAKGLGIQVGDEMTFSIAGQDTKATVASLRTVQWDSMQPNFFVIFSGEILSGDSASWLTSFYLTPADKPLLNQLAREFPTATLIELDSVIEQIQKIITQVSLAVEFILLLVLACGILVLVASIQATLDMRFKESAILRTLGARRGMVAGSLIIEFGVMGWLAGLLAVVGAEACLFFLQTKVFDISFGFHPWLWVSGPWLGMLLIGGIGYLSTRRVTRTPPLNVLRNV